MSKKSFPIIEANLDKIVGGGQTIGTLDYGKKVFAWGKPLGVGTKGFVATALMAAIVRAIFNVAFS